MSALLKNIINFVILVSEGKQCLLKVKSNDFCRLVSRQLTVNEPNIPNLVCLDKRRGMVCISQLKLSMEYNQTLLLVHVSVKEIPTSYTLTGN